MKKKKDEITIRSSAAEYLTYVASVGDKLISVFAPVIIKIFMNQSDIITNGVMLLWFQQFGMC
ncbi:MAG: hypothetical protein V8R67_12180 [Eubacterium sp.]